jgi:hypothetical protein
MSEIEIKSCRRGERPPRRAWRGDAARAIEALRKDVRTLTDRIAQLQEKQPGEESQ